MTYNSYEINPSTFAITFSGKPIFTAWWQRPATLQQAKDMIDGSIAATEAATAKLKSMPDKQAALSKLAGSCELESGAEAAERFTNWMDNEAEKQLNDYYEY